MKLRKTLPLIFAFLIILTGSCSNHSQNVSALSAGDFEKKMSGFDKIQLVDVRTPDEFNSGHLKGAVNINFYDNNFEHEMEGLDKSVPVFLYCRSGGRSSEAAEMLSSKGFKEVYNLKDGIIAWHQVDKPSDELTANDVTSGTGMSEAEFKKAITSDKLVLVDFNATWCGPCKKLSPVIDQLRDENKDKLTVIKVDIDQNHELATGMNITAIPLVQLYKNGNKVWEQLGWTEKEKIAKAIADNL